MIEQKYLIDTDVFIDFFRGDSYAVEFFSLIKNKKIKGFFSILTEGELLVGARNYSEQEMIDSLLSKMERVEATVSIVRKAAEYRKDFGKKCGIGLIDAIIAASAYYIEAKLVTRNLKHFSPIPDICLHNLKSA